ncbi:hypothetical protein V1504DRAFT_44815 [Lipomyces starkeyi]
MRHNIMYDVARPSNKDLRHNLRQDVKKFFENRRAADRALVFCMSVEDMYNYFTLDIDRLFFYHGQLPAEKEVEAFENSHFCFAQADLELGLTTSTLL